MNKDPIKCAGCGIFIKYQHIKNKKSEQFYEPDTEYTCEEIYFICDKCKDK